MEVLTRALAAAAMAALAGCSFLREPTPVEAMGEQPSVHALLVTGSDTVRVLLQRVGPRRAGQPESVSALPVEGAEVRLTVEGSEVALSAATAAMGGCTARSVGDTQSPDRAGCYAAVVPGGIRPGASYALRVRLPGGGTVEGRTTALTPLRLQDPAAGARIQVRGRGFAGPDGEQTVIRVRSAGAEGAPLAGVELIPRVVYYPGEVRTSNFFCSVEYPRATPLPRAADGTVELTVYGLTCAPQSSGNPSSPRPDSVRATLRVVAFDSAYARYAQASDRDAVAAREVTAGLTGAVGLFASAARAEHPVVLIPCPEPASCPAR